MAGIGCPFATTNSRSRFSFKYTSNMQSPSAGISISVSRRKGVTKMQQLARHYETRSETQNLAGDEANSKIEQ
jgi:hypothetical protein